MKQIFDPVMFGKVAVTGSQFLVVVLSPLFMGDDAINQLFSLLAWAAILSALISFGSNAALARHLHVYRNSSKSEFVTVIVIGKFFALSIVSYIGSYLNLFGEVKFGLLFFTSFTASLSFIDFVAESYGKDYLKKFSLIKAFIFSIFSFVKLIVLYVSSELIYYLLYLEWVFVWLALSIGTIISHSKTFTLKRFNALDVMEVISFVKGSSWVWFSSILQLGWTRGFFIILTRDIGAASANQYYIFLRVIEAFSFIPNAISMKYFSEVLYAHKSQVHHIRVRYVKNLKKIGYCIAILCPLSMYLINISILKDAIQNHYYLMISLAGFIYVLRIGLSREIVLRKVLYLSLVSYLTAMISGFVFYKILGGDSLFDALASYLAFLVICFISPFLTAPQIFYDYRILLLGSRSDG